MLYQPGQSNIVFSIGTDFFREQTYFELDKLNVRPIKKTLSSFRVENFPPGYLMSNATYT